MRTIDAMLTAALAAGTGKPVIYGVIGYANGAVLAGTYLVSYKLTGDSLEFEIAYNADIGGDQECIWLERGLTIVGVNHTAITGRFYIHSQRYLPNGHQIVKGGLFPKQYYAAAGYDTYQNVITAFCAHFGKTAVFRDPAAAWLAYKFFPAGKSIILNDANYMRALLQQKYLIFYCDNGNEEVLFYSCAGSLNVATDVTITAVNDFYKEQNNLKNRLLMWRDEAGTVHSSGAATDPIHNLGYLESTAAAPARKSPGLIMEARMRPDLRILDGDVVQLTALGSNSKMFALVTEQYIAPDHSHKEPRWETIVASNTVYDNTAGGALPSTIERVSNYTPLNTSYFTNVLSGSDNNLQAAMDTLDDHHAQPAWTAPTLTNSWVNFGGTYGPAGYYKDIGGTVHLRGLIKSGTIGQIAFTLPAGYRPAYPQIVPTTSNDLFGVLLLNTDGTVIPYKGSNVYFSLDGVLFETA